MDKYVFFWGGIYSNWYPSNFEYKGIKFNCAEQAMMWEKAMTFNDEDTAKKVLATSDPSRQKKLGRQVVGYDDTEWAKVRYELAIDFLLCKYSQNEELKRAILETGNKTLVEASPYDTIWGIGKPDTDDDICDESKWKGQNLLGKALMDVRSILQVS